MRDVPPPGFAHNVNSDKACTHSFDAGREYREAKGKHMSPQKKRLVQASFEQVLPIADSVAALFYTRLFELDPGLRFLFNAGIQEQGHKYMAMLHLVVANLDRPDTVVPMLQALGRRHATYGVNDPHYETMSEALLWALGKSLGPSFTLEVRQAWAEVYTLLADTMKAAVQPPVLNPVVM